MCGLTFRRHRRLQRPEHGTRLKLYLTKRRSYSTVPKRIMRHVQASEDDYHLEMLGHE